jgi:hypothetical protein
MNAREIKAYLKTQGIETAQIRISVDSSVNVKLLDPKLPFDRLEQLLKDKYESYQRDEATGEILSGGNTFVFIEYDYDLVAQVGEELRPTLRPFLEGCSGSWDLPALVRHYCESQPSEYDGHIVRRAVQEAFYKFFKENPADIDGLTISGWN